MLSAKLWRVITEATWWEDSKQAVSATPGADQGWAAVGGESQGYATVHLTCGLQRRSSWRLSCLEGGVTLLRKKSHELVAIFLDIEGHGNLIIIFYVVKSESGPDSRDPFVEENWQTPLR